MALTSESKICSYTQPLYGIAIAYPLLTILPLVKKLIQLIETQRLGHGQLPRQSLQLPGTAA